MADYKTEADLLTLLGESESMTLEFKGPRDFDGWPETRDKIKEDVSKQVSAFANTYGGQILLGVQETQGKAPRTADAILGLDPKSPPPETLQRMIEQNVRPRVEGLRVNSIRLSGPKEARVVYVIVVPRGTTAHQASDKRYYGRSEFESVPLDDQIVRLLMVRDRVAEARVEVNGVDVKVAASDYKARQIRLAQLEQSAREGPFEDRFPKARQLDAIREALNAPPDPTDCYRFSLGIRNTGPRTIGECLLKVTVTTPFPVECAGGAAPTWVLRLTAKVFPEEARPFPGADFIISAPHGVTPIPARLDWVLYLEDSPARTGEIDIGEEFEASLRR